MDNKIDAILKQVRDLKSDTKEVRGALSEFGENVESFFDALEDIASYVLALEGIVKAIVKSVPVDINDVVSNIAERREGEDGGDVGRAESIAEYIITGKLPE